MWQLAPLGLRFAGSFGRLCGIQIVVFLSYSNECVTIRAERGFLCLFSVFFLGYIWGLALNSRRRDFSSKANSPIVYLWVYYFVLNLIVILFRSKLDSVGTSLLLNPIGENGIVFLFITIKFHEWSFGFTMLSLRLWNIGVFWFANFLFAQYFNSL